MSRHGRRNWPRPPMTMPARSSSSGTPTPDQAQSPAEVVELELERARRGEPWEDFYGHVTIDTAALEGPPPVKARRTLEAMGFVFPGPGEAFEELGGRVHRDQIFPQ